MSGASSVLVPCEIVSPPIPIVSVAEPMDKLVVALRDAGTKGTRESVFYAFGVHLSIETPIRLANSCADEPNWTIAQSWNHSAQIAEFVADGDRLESLAAAFCEYRGRMLRGIDQRRLFRYFVAACTDCTESA